MNDFSDQFTMSGCRIDKPEIEAKKITAAHNALMDHLRKYYSDDGWHNLRAFLINRIEQLTNYRLIVVSDNDDAKPNYRILDRKTYLKEKYNFDWKENEST